MSQENVEIVRRIYDDFERDGWDSAMRFASPDIELHGTSGGLSEGNVARGIAAVREMFEEWDAEAWEETRLNPQEFIDVGDQVVVFQHELRRGRGSGVDVESETAMLFELRDGSVTRIQGFMDQEQALKAAGLRD
jgi:ketosteroid isomerase-like protein